MLSKIPLAYKSQDRLLLYRKKKKKGHLLSYLLSSVYESRVTCCLDFIAKWHILKHFISRLLDTLLTPFPLKGRISQYHFV